MFGTFGVIFEEIKEIVSTFFRSTKMKAWREASVSNVFLKPQISTNSLFNKKNMTKIIEEGT